jgi:uncharacterized glyoxalase superfamily protein PhnB
MTAGSSATSPGAGTGEAARPNIFPTLRYRDADRALAWLQDAFGFELEECFRDPAGAVAHAELRLGAGLVMLGQQRGESHMAGHPPDALASTIGIYVVVEDPSAHHERARQAGASIVRELTATDYGSREYSARDLEGNLWSFGSYDPYET